MPPGQKLKSKGWCRAFRWCRVAILLMVLAVTALLAWCNFVRVPEFIAARVKREFRARNILVEFARLRLSGFRSLVAHDLHLSRLDATGGAFGPMATAKRAEVLLDAQKLRHGIIQVAGLRVNQGEVSLSLASPAGTPRMVKLSQIDTEVNLAEDDTLNILQFSGDLLGTRTRVSGSLRHVSEIQPAGAKAGQTEWQAQLSEVLRILDELKFTEPPVFTVRFKADAAKPAATLATMTIRAGATSSRWGTLRRLELTSGLFPQTNALRTAFTLDVQSLGGPWFRGDSIHLRGESIWTTGMDRLLTNHLSFAAQKPASDWASSGSITAELASSQSSPGALITSSVSAHADGVQLSRARLGVNSFQATLKHKLPFPSPATWLGSALAAPSAETRAGQPNLSGDWQFQAADLHDQDARVASVSLSGKILSREDNAPLPDSLGFWSELAPFRVPWQAGFSNIVARQVKLGSLEFQGEWDFPRLTLGSVQAQLYGGALQANAVLNVRDRLLFLSTASEFDYGKLAFLLDTNVQTWLSQFSWERPPQISAKARLELPDWTQSWAGKRGEILGSLQLDGRFAGPATFRGIPFENAESHFSFDDFVWSLPDLRISRPEGEALISYRGNVTNQDFTCRIESQIDPGMLRSLFPEDQQVAFDFLKFSTPPLLRGESTGNWAKPESIHFQGSVEATNFFVKEQAFTDVRTDLAYANHVIECRNAIGHRGAEEIRAPYLRVDFPREVLFVTNAVSTIDPWVAMSLVGEDAYDAIEPYRFDKTPLIRINGDVPLRHWSKANVHFEVAGEDFSFWKLHMANIAGDVWWKADHLNLSNVVANFYGGQARWSGSFFIDQKHAQFSFTGITTNTDLRPLVRDLFGTNNLEGALSGELVITSANSGNDNSWNGYGRATLKDGYLWSIPLFGVFSPVLDTIAPGLGKSRISSGTGNFSITNSVIYTRDMQVRAPAFRLDYKGKVDLEGRLEARAEAEILRDAWMFGKLVSAALWPVSKAFEAQITGTLQQPKTRLRFFPSFVFAPFKVLNALGEAVKKGDQPPEPPPGQTPPPRPNPAAPAKSEAEQPPTHTNPPE